MNHYSQKRSKRQVLDKRHIAWMTRHSKDFASLRGKVSVLARSREAYFRDDAEFGLSEASAVPYVKAAVARSMMRARRYTACAYRGSAGASGVVCTVDAHDEGDDGGGSDDGDGSEADHHSVVKNLKNGIMVIRNRALRPAIMRCAQWSVFFVLFIRQEVTA